MRLIADVHGAADKLAALDEAPGPVVVLGDLINFVDYRTRKGIVAQACGEDFTAELIRLRDAGDTDGSRALWDGIPRDRRKAIRERIDALVDEQYQRVFSSASHLRMIVTFGNADRPERLRAFIPEGATFIEWGALEISGLRVGILGGGLPLAGGVPVPGEITEADLAERLSAIGPVDVLCTHVPPAIPALETDVLGGRQKGSTAVLEYLEQHSPPFHYFGDIHQPQATDWLHRGTRCINVGYFRATGRPVEHDARS